MWGRQICSALRGSTYSACRGQRRWCIGHALSEHSIDGRTTGLTFHHCSQADLGINPSRDSQGIVAMREAFFLGDVGLKLEKVDVLLLFNPLYPCSVILKAACRCVPQRVALEGITGEFICSIQQSMTSLPSSTCW